MYDAKYTSAIVEQVHELSTARGIDTFMSFSSRYAYNQTADGYTMTVMQAYYEPVEFPPVFQELNRIPHTSSTLHVDRMSSFAADAVSPHGAR